MNLNFSIRGLPHINTRHWFKLLPIATSLILIALAVVAVLFLHRYFYQTIAQARVVFDLRTKVAFNQVDLPLFQQVFAAWESKKKFDPAALDALRDPFKTIIPAPATGPSLEEANATP